MAGLREDHLGVISSLQCGSAVPTQHSPCPTARVGLGMGPFRVKIMEEVFTKPGGTVGEGGASGRTFYSVIRSVTTAERLSLKCESDGTSGRNHPLQFEMHLIGFRNIK